MRPLLSLALALVCLSGCAPVEFTSFVEWLPAGRRVIIAHRGGAHLAPENTLEAFHRAGEADAESEVIELDLHLSADGEVMVAHDRSIDRMTGEGRGCDIEQDPEEGTNGEILLRDLTVDEIQSHDAGFCFEDLDGDTSYRGLGVVMPTLRKVLEELPGRRFILEIKQHEPPIVEPLLELVEELGAFERSCFLSFNDETNALLAEGAPPEACFSLSSMGIRCFGTEDVVPFGGVPCQVRDLAVVPHENSGVDLKRTRLVNNMQAYSMPVFMFTPNDVETITTALEVGADGVITDRPDLARQVIGPVRATGETR